VPFIPSYTSLIPTSTPAQISEMSDDSWFPIFWEGVSTKDEDSQQLHAANLVDSIEWESESLAVLSQHFCWKGAEGDADGVGSVVLFARVVHDCFRATYGDWYANCLTRHIRECVVGHFKACWKSVSLCARSTLPLSELLVSAGTTSIYHIRQSAVDILSFFSPQPHDIRWQSICPRSSSSLRNTSLHLGPRGGIECHRAHTCNSPTFTPCKC
jgi:hypothetical protein